MISVLLVDDHAMMLDAWAHALTMEPGFSVDAVVSSVADALGEITTHPPFDVVIVDVRLGDDSGFDLLPALDLDRTAVIFVSAHGSPAYVDAAQRCGARGFFLKTSTTASLVEGVKRVATGGTAWDPETMRRTAHGRWQPLSEVERRLVESLIAGRSNGEVGLDLGISTKTVESHLTKLYRRYMVETRVDLIRRALDEGWLDLPLR